MTEKNLENQTHLELDAIYNSHSVEIHPNMTATSRSAYMRKKFDLRPEFSKKSVFAALKVQFKSKLKISFRYYESELYSLCYRYRNDFFSEIPVLETVRRLHHIVQLKNSISNLDANEVKTLNLSMQQEVDRNLAIFREYTLCRELLLLLSSLVIKWGISNIFTISYRFQNLITSMTMLNIGCMNSDYFSMETLALAVYTQEFPLNSLLTTECKQFAQLLTNCIEPVFNEFLKANEDYECIASTLESSLPFGKNPKQDFQTLYIPSFLQFLCKRTAKIKRAKHLKSVLQHFELTYRTFEESLVSSFLSLNKAKYGCS